MPLSAAKKLLLLFGRRAAAAFTPSTLTGLQLWLDASVAASLFQDSALTTPASVDTDPVGGWKDQGPLIKNALQATGGARPVLRTGILNSKPILRFLAVTQQKMATASIAHGIGPGDFYIAFVIKTAGAYVTSTLYNLSANVDFAPGFYLKWPTPMLYFGAEKVFAATLSVSTAYLLEFWRNAGVLYCAVNGVQDANTFAVATSISDAVQSIGSSRLATTEPFTGDIAEIAFYNALPSAQNRALLESYWSAKWGLGF